MKSRSPYNYSPSSQAYVISVGRGMFCKSSCSLSDHSIPPAIPASVTITDLEQLKTHQVAILIPFLQMLRNLFSIGKTPLPMSHWILPPFTYASPEKKGLKKTFP